MSHEKLIDNLCAYFDAKLSDTPTEQEKHLFPQLVDLRRSIKNGNTEIRTVSTWWVFWRSKNSQMDEVRAYDERDAMTKLGYGNGAMTAVDFIAEAPERWRLVLPVTLGDHDRDHDTKTMVEWYRKGLHKLLCEFVEADRPQDLIRLWRGLRDQQERTKFLYEGRAFTATFCEMTSGLMGDVVQFLTSHHPDELPLLEAEDDEE